MLLASTLSLPPQPGCNLTYPKPSTIEDHREGHLSTAVTGSGELVSIQTLAMSEKRDSHKKCCMVCQGQFPYWLHRGQIHCPHLGPGCRSKGVRKLDLSHLCFSLSFYFLMFLLQFPSMFPLLTYSQSFFSLSADYLRYSRRRRSKIQFS